MAVRQGATKVLGYYAISAHGVRREDLPDDQSKGLPRIDIPVVLLGRLAVDRSAQGCGLGSLLLLDALRRIELLAEQVGIRAVEVDAIDDAARRFYLKYGIARVTDSRSSEHPPLERRNPATLARGTSRSLMRRHQATRQPDSWGSRGARIGPASKALFEVTRWTVTLPLSRFRSASRGSDSCSFTRFCRSWRKSQTRGLRRLPGQERLLRSCWNRELDGLFRRPTAYSAHTRHTWHA
ncbi:MAG: GNAT family N-acetyltransferase, partial [Isosphaeraceae bacterium]